MYSLDQQILDTDLCMYMFGYAHFMCSTQKFNKGKNYQDGNHDQDEESSWASVSNMPVRFHWCSILEHEQLRPSFMWCLMIF
jgi:hypothetical protein